MNKNGLVVNLFWKFSERILAQLITLIVSIVLARILDPTHYGTVSLVMIFITIANVFVSDGFGNALIQKKDADKLDFSSVLFFNIGFSIFLYLILFFCAPLISGFYGDGYEILVPVLRVLGLRLIPAGINSVQHAYVSKHMMFRKFFWSTLFGTLLSGVIGITMAYLGYGVWALVAQYLTNTIVDTIVLTITLGKIFCFKFSWTRVKGMIGFGSRILASGLLIVVYQEVRALIIGKLYSAQNLAFYEKGKSFPNLIVTNVNTSIGAVLFPKMSNEQDDLAKVKETTRNSIRFSAYVMCPMMLGLAAIAPTFIKLVLTEKWMPCVPLLQLFCIVYLFQPIHTANMQAIKAVGRSDILLKLEFTKKIIELVTILITMWLGVPAIVVGMAICATFFTLFNAYPNIKLINYRFKEQMQDILPSIFISVVMFLVVNVLQFLPISDFPLIMLQVIVGSLVYLILSFVTKNTVFTYIFTYLEKFLQKKKA